MTKKEFKYAMQRGLGSCVLELENTQDIEKYQSTVLWGCAHDMAYDAQCEGCRSLYLYELITRFPDKTPFFDAIEQSLYKYMGSTGWEFAQAIELLALFVRHENTEKARAGLIMKNCYDALFQILLKKRRRTKYGLLPECDNFERLCGVLAAICSNDRTLLMEQYKKMVSDAGTIIEENGICSYFNFESFQKDCEKYLGKRTVYKLLYRADADEGTKAYVCSMEEDFHERAKARAQQKNNNPETADEIYRILKAEGDWKRAYPCAWFTWGRRMMRQNKQQEIEKLAAYYKNDSRMDIRYMLLRLLRNKDCAWALDIEQLIADTKLKEDDLVSCAFEALTYIKDAKVREYALELIQNGTHETEGLLMLIKNYENADKDFVVNAVKQIPITYEDGTWHWVFGDIMDLFASAGKQKPKELLPYMYRNTLCSLCRKNIVKEMGRRRMLTKELLTELQHDCNKDIRAYAKKKLRRSAAL